MHAYHTPRNGRGVGRGGGGRGGGGRGAREVRSEGRVSGCNAGRGSASRSRDRDSRILPSVIVIDDDSPDVAFGVLAPAAAVTAADASPMVTLSAAVGGAPAVAGSNDDEPVYPLCHQIWIIWMMDSQTNMAISFVPRSCRIS